MNRRIRTRSFRTFCKQIFALACIGLFVVLAAGIHRKSAIAAIPSASGNTLFATTTASDDASDADYAAWDDGDNGGSGFGAWSLTTTSGNSGENGHFSGSGTDIDTGGRAWCMYANNGQEANAIRSFSNTIEVGQTVSWQMDNGGVGGAVGVSLRNASNENVFEVFAENGDANYTVNGNSEVDSGLAVVTSGIQVDFTLTSSTEYSVVLTPLAGGSSVTLTGTLASPAGGTTISEIRLFNFNAGSGSANDVCFNSLSVTDRTDDIVFNEILFNPHNITPSNGQNCDGDGTIGEDGGSSDDAADEFFEFYNNGTENIHLGGYCIASQSNAPGASGSSGENDRWLIPDDADWFIPAGGYLAVCGHSAFRVDSGGTNSSISTTTGFSIEDGNGDEVAEFRNSGDDFLLYLPSTPGDCQSGIGTSIINTTIPNGEASGESYQRCPDVSGNLDYYDFDGNFYYPTPGSSNCFATTPVTISYFHIERVGEELLVEWATSTETGNLGFKLYVERDGKRELLTKEPVPSHNISSTEVQRYSITVPDVGGETFYLEDVDFQGYTKEWGAFELNVLYGQQPVSNPIDWNAIWQEHAEKASEREAEAQAHVEALLQQDGRQAIATNVPLVNLVVSETGIHRVTDAELQTAGFDFVGLNSAEIALINRAQPVPITIGGGEIWNVDSYIEFIGAASDTLYTTKNVYSLHLDSNRAVRIATDDSVATGSPAAWYTETVRLDTNLEYDVTSPLGEPWYHKRMVARGVPLTQTVSVEVTDIVSGVAPAELDVSVWGGTDYPDDAPDHRVVAYVAGQTVADLTFDGLQPHMITATLGASALQNGSNTIELVLPADHGYAWDIVNIDAVEVRYPRGFVARDGGLMFAGSAETFAVTNLVSQPVVYRTDENGTARLTNVSFADTTATIAGRLNTANYRVQTVDTLLSPTISAASESLDITTGMAQYLVITHPDFADDLQPLVDFHTERALQVRVVNVEDVYAQFGFGVIDAEAIHMYIQHAVEQMQTEYVLLVGGDNYDYQQFKYNGLSFIPSLYRPTGTIVRWAPADPAYADVDEDGVPDVALGRFPVRTSAELATVIQKTINYSAADYAATALFASDLRDGSMNFAEDSTHFAELLPPTWQTQQVALDRDGLTSARSELLGAINDGVALTTYLGHSGPTQWTWSGLFNTTDAQNLTNSAAPTIFAQFGCWNSYYVSPLENTLGHFLMLDGLHGAAAAFGATTLTSEKADVLLGRLLMEQFAADDNVRLGDALVAAKQALEAEHPGLADVQLGWTLLGDPALSLAGADEVPTATKLGAVSAESTRHLGLLISALSFVLLTVHVTKRRLRRDRVTNCTITPR